MHRHHKETIGNVVRKLKADPGVMGIIVAGSLAHGFERKDSDVDLIIVVKDADYARRLRQGNFQYFERESCTYKEGYIDGKYTSLGMLRRTAKSGSEPARYAFKDARLAFSRDRRIGRVLKRIVRYPAREKRNRIRRFYAQLEAWRWYYYEGVKLGNAYLQMTALAKVILFGCRLILAYNGSLYPYHKWLLKEVERQKRKPDRISDLIAALTEKKQPAQLEAFYSAVKKFIRWRDGSFRWANQFMLDSELNWMKGDTPVDDL